MSQVKEGICRSSSTGFTQLFWVRSVHLSSFAWRMESRYHLGCYGCSGSFVRWARPRSWATGSASRSESGTLGGNASKSPLPSWFGWSKLRCAFRVHSQTPPECFSFYVTCAIILRHFYPSFAKAASFSKLSEGKSEGQSMNKIRTCAYWRSTPGLNGPSQPK